MLPGTIIVIYWDHSGALFPSDVSRGLLSQSSREAAGAAFPSQREQPQPRPQATPIPFGFSSREGSWNGLGSQSPSPEQGHPPHPALDTSRGLAATAAPGKDRTPAPSPRGDGSSSAIPQISQGKKSSSSALCQRLHLISLGKPHIFVKSCGCHYSI